MYISGISFKAEGFPDFTSGEWNGHRSSRTAFVSPVSAVNVRTTWCLSTKSNRCTSMGRGGGWDYGFQSLRCACHRVTLIVAVPLLHNTITAWGAQPHRHNQHGPGSSCWDAVKSLNKSSLFCLMWNSIAKAVNAAIWRLCSKVASQEVWQPLATAPSCVLSPITLSSFENVTRNHNRHRLRFLWKFWKCWNQPAVCRSAEINLQGQRVWKHVAG